MKLDIHAVLEILDENNLGVYKALAEEPAMLVELKKNISWLIPQWMTASRNHAHHQELVLAFDDICNPGWGSFYKHPELQTKLLALVGRGKKTVHTFFRPMAGKAKNIKDIEGLLRAEYSDIRNDEISLWCRDTTKDDLEALMDDLGVQIEDRDTIRKQYDNGNRRG